MLTPSQLFHLHSHRCSCSRFLLLHNKFSSFKQHLLIISHFPRDLESLHSLIGTSASRVAQGCNQGIFCIAALSWSGLPKLTQVVIRTVACNYKTDVLIFLLTVSQGALSASKPRALNGTVTWNWFTSSQAKESFLTSPICDIQAI